MEDIKKLVLPLLAERDVELVELRATRERGRSCLRFLVTKPAGIALDECAGLNQQIGQLLDREDIVPEKYILEVSSPGLDRPLGNTRDFQRNLGKAIRIVLHRPINGQNVWSGSLDKVDEENITINTEQGQQLRIPRENIARAKLEVEV